MKARYILSLFGFLLASVLGVASTSSASVKEHKSDVSKIKAAETSVVYLVTPHNYDVLAESALTVDYQKMVLSNLEPSKLQDTTYHKKGKFYIFGKSLLFYR